MKSEEKEIKQRTRTNNKNTDRGGDEEERQISKNQGHFMISSE